MIEYEIVSRILRNGASDLTLDTQSNHTRIAFVILVHNLIKCAALRILYSKLEIAKRRYLFWASDMCNCCFYYNETENNKMFIWLAE